MSEELDTVRAETRLRAHYRRLDPAPLRADTVERIRAGLLASTTSATDAATGPRSNLGVHLGPVRANAPGGRLRLGWPIVAAAALALLAITWVASSRLAGPPVAGSPSALATTPAASPESAAPSASPSGEDVVEQPIMPQHAIAFADRTHGIIVGEHAGQGAVWTTADEGQTWTSTLVPTPPLDSVAVLGSHAWASATCSDGVAGCTPAFFRSGDGGQTWTSVSKAAIGSLTFVDDQHGWGTDAASPDSPWLMATDDGGQTWAPRRTPCGSDMVPIAVSFADAAHGWVACGGAGAGGGSSKELVASVDGGASWTVRSRVHMDGSGSLGRLPIEGVFRGVEMLVNGTGVAWTWNEGLLRTTDGGATWTRLPLGEIFGNLQWPGASITADGGLFALTVDVNSADASATFNIGIGDGRDWKPYTEFARLPTPGTSPTPEPTDAPRPALADSVAFFDALHGIATGGDANHAYLWLTADGGAKWQVSVLDATSAAIMAVHGDRGWMTVSSCPAGAPGGPRGSCTSSLERSDDRGVTWAAIGGTSPTTMSFGDKSVGFGVGPLPRPVFGDTTGGMGGDVYRTTDGGTTWTPLANPRPCGSLDPVSVSFVSATRGWLGCTGMGGAGQASKGVMETTDGGGTWTWRSRVYGPSGSPPAIGSISISDYLTWLSMDADGHGMWVGGRDLTFRTSDGGRTWVSCPPGEFDAFVTSPATIVPGGSWFVVQSGSNIGTDPLGAARLMRSDDQGASWKQVGGLIPSPPASVRP